MDDDEDDDDDADGEESASPARPKTPLTSDADDDGDDDGDGNEGYVLHAKEVSYKKGDRIIPGGMFGDRHVYVITQASKKAGCKVSIEYADETEQVFIEPAQYDPPVDTSDEYTVSIGWTKQARARFIKYSKALTEKAKPAKPVKHARAAPELIETNVARQVCHRTSPSAPRHPPRRPRRASVHAPLALRSSAGYVLALYAAESVRSRPKQRRPGGTLPYDHPRPDSATALPRRGRC